MSPSASRDGESGQETEGGRRQEGDQPLSTFREQEQVEHEQEQG